MREGLRSVLLSTGCYILYFYIRLVYSTSRWTKINHHKLDKALRNKQPIILAFWHGRLSMMPNFAPFPEEVSVMISRHGDGEFIARIIKNFGLRVIRGSTNRKSSDKKGKKNRGGSSAIREALAVIKAGSSIAITPDGPRGPGMKVNSTIADIARLSGAPIFPVSFSSSLAINLKSWDRFLLPLPFGKAVFNVGEPIIISEGEQLSIEKYKQIIEDSLNKITQEADSLVKKI